MSDHLQLDIQVGRWRDDGLASCTVEVKRVDDITRERITVATRTVTVDVPPMVEGDQLSGWTLDAVTQILANLEEAHRRRCNVVYPVSASTT